MQSRIEIATPVGDSTKDKGDLLEKLATRLLQTQSYEVETQVRVTAAEIDLLCQHKVNGRRIYVECKALRDNLSAVVLRTLLGTVAEKDLDEGWLISAGPLGKDAKGFKSEWELKPLEKRQKLSIYSPGRVIKALADAKVIAEITETEATELLPAGTQVGECILLITHMGEFWAVTSLRSGVPTDVAIFEAKTKRRVTDLETLRALASTDSSLALLNFEFLASKEMNTGQVSASPGSVPTIVEVKHGESWDDYRPARPQDFVGRQSAQDRVLGFLENVRDKSTDTRIFAITGDTGMGKSSLVAKLRDRSKGTRYRSKFFVYAVDVRAATSARYVLGSLLAALRAASSNGIGETNANDIAVTNYVDPLTSDSIRRFLDSVSQRNQMICLIFDQFEELYSKPELFPVFEEALRLCLSVAAASAPLAVGFVWRTDCSLPQQNPAYYFWHRLADHRFESRLRVFSNSEISSALTLFEKVLAQKLRPELRRQLSENCEGYPWLLKKLCIHVYEQIRAGRDQAHLDEAMDVKALFDRDLASCNSAERTCIETIAKQSPADWYEILELFGNDIVTALQDKRLILRSGDRLNLYWDIFREYVISKEPPPIPFTYLCSSPSVGAFLSVASRLSKTTVVSSDDLSTISGLSAKTISNVIHDLVMFGIATGRPSAVSLAEKMAGSSENQVLERVRTVLRRHAVRIALYENDLGKMINAERLAIALREVNPGADHSQRTWDIYAERLGPWFVAAGFLEVMQGGWLVRDRGSILVPTRRGSRSRIGGFLADAPPNATAEALLWLHQTQSPSVDEVRAAGHRNAFRVLTRLELISQDDDGRYVTVHNIESKSHALRLIGDMAATEDTLLTVLNFLETKPGADGRDIGCLISQNEGLDWSGASQLRTGNALRVWASWLMGGDGGSRTAHHATDTDSLFGPAQ
jgi:hypothetical protein